MFCEFLFFQIVASNVEGDHISWYGSLNCVEVWCSFDHLLDENLRIEDSVFCKFST